MAAVRTVLVAAGIGVALLAGCGRIPPAESASPSDSPPPASSASASAPVVPAAGDTCEYVPTGRAARPVNPPPASNVPTTGKVTYALTTNNGPVKITMDRAKAPCTVNSFASLADQGYFDKTKCHRLVDSGIFVLQCGDPTGTGSGGPGYQFADETNGKEHYARGVVAMANAGPGTNGSQFFMIWADSSALDSSPNYTIFGTMDKASTDVVAAIAASGQDGSNPDGSGKPNNPAEIVSVTRG